jgi:hypothetical protein
MKLTGPTRSARRWTTTLVSEWNPRRELTLRRHAGWTLALAIVLASCSSAPSDRSASSPPSSQIQATLAWTEGEVSDGVAVEVRGSELPAGYIELVQCASVGGEIHLERDCDMTKQSRGGGETKEGTLVARFSFKKFVGIGARREIDCPGVGCSLVAVDGQGAIVARRPISWDEIPPVTRRPHLKILAMRFGNDRGAGWAIVVGRQFPNQHAVLLSQCPDMAGVEDPGVDASDCLYSLGTRIHSSARGTFKAKVRVFARFQRSSGELVDCLAEPEVCALAEPWPRGKMARMSEVLFSER